MTQDKAVRQAMLRKCSWVALDSTDWRGWLAGLVETEQHDLVTLDRQVMQEMKELDRYERMDPEGKGWEETKDEEEGLRSVGRLLLGG